MIFKNLGKILLLSFLLYFFIRKLSLPYWFTCLYSWVLIIGLIAYIVLKFNKKNTNPK